VSGASGSKRLFVQNRVVSSVSPVLVMLWTQPYMQGPCEICRGLANKEVSRLGTQERVLNQIHGLLQSHEESRHLRLCQGKGPPGLNTFNLGSFEGEGSRTRVRGPRGGGRRVWWARLRG